VIGVVVDDVGIPVVPGVVGRELDIVAGHPSIGVFMFERLERKSLLVGSCGCGPSVCCGDAAEWESGGVGTFMKEGRDAGWSGEDAKGREGGDTEKVVKGVKRICGGGSMVATPNVSLPPDIPPP
jgi:hypothetical protein